MIASEVYIKGYDWHFTIYYAVTCYWTEKIVYKLKQLGAGPKVLISAYKNLSSCELDKGLTYSNNHSRESIVVIGLTSNKAEFLDSFTHELRHLVNHICDAYGIDLYGEESCYLTGDTAKQLFPDIERFMCDCHNPIKCNCHGKEHKKRN